MNIKRIWAAAPIMLLIALFIVPTSAFAHERRTIANGKYDVTVGWDQEPTYVGLKNAASIRIAQAGSNPAVPVTGAEKNLKVQIRQGATTKEFPLRAVFGQQGYYVADIVPTREGDYQWTFVGSINDDQVNEKFDTADGKFGGAEPLTGLEFPQALPDPGADERERDRGASRGAKRAQPRLHRHRRGRARTARPRSACGSPDRVRRMRSSARRTSTPESTVHAALARADGDPPGAWPGAGSTSPGLRARQSGTRRADARRRPRTIAI